jgi:peptidyl-prolyl cis-trans isomerase D
MLDIIRNLVASIFGKILLGIMVLSFALWGVGDLLNSGNSQLAAKVGKQKVTLDDFYYEFQRSIDDFNNSLEKRITLAEAYEEKIHTLVINEMVYDQMINVYANNNNIFVNNEILKKIIKSMPQFQNEDGSFNKTIYEYSIQDAFPSEKIFLDEVRNLYLRGHLFDLFDSSISLNKKIHKLILDFEGETRDFEYFTINNIPFDEPVLTETELNDYFTENEKNFRVPKSVILDLIQINYQDFANDVDIDETILKEEYENNLAAYTTPETRDIEFARFDNILDANNYREIILNLSDTEIKSYNKENDVSFNKIENLKFDDFDIILAEKIFNLSEGKISKPIDTEELGFYIVKLNSINLEKVISFEEASNEIRQNLIQDEAYDIFDETVNLADELLISGYGLNEISDEINIEVSKNIDFREISNSIESTEFLVTINSEDIGYQSEIYLDDDTATIVKIVNITESYIPKFEDVRNEVVSKLIEIKQNQFLDDTLTNIALEIKPNGADGFYKFAYANSAKLNKVNSVKRSLPNNIIDPETQKELFKIDQDNILMFKNNGNYGILLLTDIKTESEDEEFISQIKENINNNFESSLLKILEKEIINNIEYQIFSQNINNIF